MGGITARLVASIQTLRASVKLSSPSWSMRVSWLSTTLRWRSHRTRTQHSRTGVLWRPAPGRGPALALICLRIMGLFHGLLVSPEYEKVERG
jgi:hypothetical protein